MAARRMFSKSVVKDDNFTELSKDARLLYFYLGLEADDDGFISSSRTIMNEAGVSEEALKELVDADFIIKFETKVILIRHWKQNNQIRSDRHCDTVHKKEMKLVYFDNESKTYELLTNNDNQMSTNCQPNDTQMAAEWLSNGKPSIDKYSIDENREDKYSLVETSIGESRLPDCLRFSSLDEVICTD